MSGSGSPRSVRLLSANVNGRRSERRKHGQNAWRLSLPQQRCAICVHQIAPACHCCFMSVAALRFEVVVGACMHGPPRIAGVHLQATAVPQEEERRQADLEENRGVELRVRLSAAPAAPGDAAARGIRRAADKLVLPPSVGEALLAQGAPRNGAMLFEVAAPNGGVTHAGVLEFAAPEGVVLLPSKVSDCLWGQSSASGGGMDDATAGPGPNSAGAAAATAPRCSGPVWVRYKRLPKGTYVRFQPALRAFHEEVGNDAEQLRSALEACLLGYCTLSEGDWVQVTEDEDASRVECLLPDRPATRPAATHPCSHVHPSPCLLLYCCNAAIAAAPLSTSKGGAWRKRVCAACAGAATSCSR